MKRYSIRGRARGSDNLVEIAQCDSNPNAVALAAIAKTAAITAGHRTVNVAAYDAVEILDTTTGLYVPIEKPAKKRRRRSVKE